ncbi:imelysin family protein [Geothrix sp. 21YS21S-4]|uniref:imelysin family protein n=1 Tax=Geothrix sp. 21YS21S-4 TaxID=3068889 RepID=UPI0027B8A743|nr:imelysin family protein [Geothrix sp. 21YS21S-4]
MHKRYFAPLAAVSLVFGLACSSSSKTAETPVDTVSLLDGFTNTTVIPTYRSMSDQATALAAACQTFGPGITAADVQTACDRWAATREQWEKSEAFLFGPADYYSLDPALDSWPLDKNKLDQELAKIANGSITGFNAAYVRNNYDETLKGFHAIEYVLFRNGAPRTAANAGLPSAAEITYVKAVSEVLRDDSITLEASWAGFTKVSAQKQAFLTQAGISIPSLPYSDEMIKAGQGSAVSRFSSPAAALGTVLQGCIDISEEVGNAKIAGPAATGNILDVESWYSWNSTLDFQNNIRSVENTYLGGVDASTRNKGLTVFVAAKNSGLDAEIRTRISAAITAIGAMGRFEDRLSATDPKVVAAIAACNDLRTSLIKVRALI